MSLLTKTVIVVVITVIITTFVLYFASQMTLLQGYLEIEETDTRVNVQRTLNTFIDQSAKIIPSARAYGYWDDMYQFTQTPNQAFIDSLGLTPGVYATHNVNLIAILDSAYNPVFLKMYDLVTSASLEIPSDLADYLKEGSPILGHTEGNAEKSGVILLNGKPMYIASVGSLHTDFSGVPSGAVIFGRYLDDKVVAALADATRLGISTYLLNDSPVSGEVAAAFAALNNPQNEQPVYVSSHNESTIVGYTYVRTIDDKPAFMLKVDIPRTIYAQGVTSFRYFAGLSALAGIGFILVTILLLRQFVLSPLLSLSQQINHIRSSGDNSLRMTVQGKSELASLGNTINGMLAALESRSRELKIAKQAADMARDKALEADRVKSQFLASMSHELRTPLNSILNFSEFMHMGLLGEVTPDQKSALRNVTESGQHLLALINDVLDVSKMQSGMLKLNIESNVDLGKEIETVIATTRSLLSQKPVVLKVDVPSDLPRIEGDKRRIRQVLLNLLSNAVKFTDEGSITFKAEPLGDEVQLSVSDTGPGIREDEQHRLFKPFEQTESGIKRTGGTGLGLAISKALVDAHGGSIRVESAAGQGATFFVRLPITRRSASSATT